MNIVASHEHTDVTIHRAVCVCVLVICITICSWIIGSSERKKRDLHCLVRFGSVWFRIDWECVCLYMFVYQAKRKCNAAVVEIEDQANIDWEYFDEIVYQIYWIGQWFGDMFVWSTNDAISYRRAACFLLFCFFFRRGGVSIANWLAS